MLRPLFSCAVLILLNFSLTAQASKDFEHIKIDIRAKRINFFEAVEHIEIIRIEETESSLLGRIEWYLKTPKGFAIPDKENDPIIYIFDEKGNYKTTINGFGQGPDEYRGFINVWMKNGLIEFYSGLSRELHRYSSEGKFVETVKAGYENAILGGGMIPTKFGYALHTLPKSPKARPNYSLIFLDHNLDLRSKAVPVKNPIKMGINLGKRFRYLEDKLFYKRISKDTIYEIKGEEVIPRFKLDFGEDWTWNDPKKQYDNEKCAGCGLRRRKSV